MHWRQQLKPIFVWLIGQQETTTLGSRSRRIFSRVTLLMLLPLIYAVFVSAPEIDGTITGIIIALFYVLWAGTFFVVIVGWVIFFSNKSYPPDPSRLIADVAISGAMTIISFAVLYRNLGIIDTLNTEYIASGSDYLYFSTVTFSTLGFGDFRPSENARLFASLQAISGNLHLGLLAGSVFYALQQKSQSSDKAIEETDNDKRE